MRKNVNGITLVALVITIIILLILAGITISQLSGSGLFENAKLAEQKSKESQEKEDGILTDYENSINEYLTGTSRNDGLVKKTDVLGFPDYTNRTSLALNTEYIADENMWIILDTTGVSNSHYSSMIINIDGTSYTFYQGFSGQDYDHLTNSILPIKKGSEFKITGAGSYNIYKVYMKY